MKFDLDHYIYPSQRRVILGKRCAVATSQSLATLAGIEMFQQGGNAVDAAIATAITLTVVEPTSNGIGSDAFALVWDGKLHGLNASGKSSENLPLEAYNNLKEMPQLGWLTVTVPGAVSAWYTLWKRWGQLPFEALFSPAIRYAKEGFPVSPVTAQIWRRKEAVYLSRKSPEFQPFKEIFFPKNRAPKTGEIWGSYFHANTLKEIAQTGGESFYTGKLAQKFVNFSSETGGFLTLNDLAKHEPLWADPISTNYKELDVWEMPPNGQGIAALIALNILEGLELEKYPRDSIESFHYQIEAMKLAFADVYSHVSDSDYMRVSLKQLLDKKYGKKRQNLITSQAITLANPGIPKGGTVYLCTADTDLMVSFIQSNYDSFGSGILIPETGISLHNRGSAFTLEDKHPNQIAPNKRPFHTIIPGFLTQNNQPLGPFGVMGAPMQPQGHLQMVVNLLDYQMNPQTALDAPRWRFLEGNRILLERGLPPEIIQGLRQRGHDINLAPETMFGKGQMILRNEGVLVSASEPRADGLALAY
ncbi:gamma-glutamyltransferase family protein [Aphanothece sacrum]|uniref:Gamma-glutamyltranspeptidase n=1 Tax=Aphanothece sacrum FPU1 TaxID=1920663 RepID=A0A401IEY6_APHSA|nr:gamma-glutamyltransferase family protein [Aphanothece sacrum]GBF79804.1 gamma-glutamyltranspeptidase [Aphanothece sacrum FPU1]GBF84816.1 gamma-glutamyltranspeptidase [Aphanothece sacrum FPU3]